MTSEQTETRAGQTGETTNYCLVVTARIFGNEMVVRRGDNNDVGGKMMLMMVMVMMVMMVML